MDLKFHIQVTKRLYINKIRTIPNKVKYMYFLKHVFLSTYFPNSLRVCTLYEQQINTQVMSLLSTCKHDQTFYLIWYSHVESRHSTYASLCYLNNIDIFQYLTQNCTFTRQITLYFISLVLLQMYTLMYVNSSFKQTGFNKPGQLSRQSIRLRILGLWVRVPLWTRILHFVFCRFRRAPIRPICPIQMESSMTSIGGIYIYAQSWLVILRINVDLAIFQPYLDLEAGDKPISENSSGEAGNRTPVLLLRKPRA